MQSAMSVYARVCVCICIRVCVCSMQITVASCGRTEHSTNYVAGSLVETCLCLYDVIVVVVRVAVAVAAVCAAVVVVGRCPFRQQQFYIKRCVYKLSISKTAKPNGSQMAKSTRTTN